MKLKMLFKKKWLRVAALSLATVTVLGAAVGLASALNRKDLSLGAVPNDPDLSLIPEYGLRASDYAALYVQDGLKACYMAYSFETITASEDDKDANVYSWKNHVAGGESATLYGADYWQGLGGGIGYKMTYDQWLSDADKVGCSLPYSPEEMVENGGIHLEAVLAYDGLKNEDGTRYHSSAVTYNKLKSAFRFGLVSSLAFVGDKDGSAGESFSTRWFLTQRGFGTEYYDYLGSGKYPFVNIAGYAEFDRMPTVLNGRITSFSYASRYDSSTDRYAFNMRYGLPTYTSQEYLNTSVSSANYKAVAADASTNKADKLSLFNGYPGRLYAIRVYEGKELTEIERTRNYFVDLLAFYRVNVKDVLRLSPDEQALFLKNCGNRANGRGIEMSYENFNVVRAELFEIINSLMP